VPFYDLRLELLELQLGHLLNQSPMLGRMSASVAASGHGFEPEKLVTQLDASLEHIELNGYDYRQIQLSATGNRGIWQTALALADTNVRFNLKALASLRPDSQALKVVLQMPKIHLHPLKLYDSNLVVSTNLEATIYDFDLENMDARIAIKDLRFQQDGADVSLDSMVMAMENDSSRHTIFVKSPLLDLDYAGSASIDEVLPAVMYAINKRLGNQVAAFVSKEEAFKLKMELKPHPLYQSIFVPGLKEFSGVSILSDFDFKQDVLNLNANLNRLMYNDNLMENFTAQVRTADEKLAYNLGFDKVENPAVLVSKTLLTGKLENKVLDFTLRVSHPDSGQRLSLSGQVDKQMPQKTLIRFTGDPIVIENQRWQFSPENKIELTNRGINIRHVGLENNRQKLLVNSAHEQANAPIDIRFEQFEIGTFSQLIEKDTALLRGRLNGVVQLVGFDPFVFTSNLIIDSIAVMENPVGSLNLLAENTQPGRYTANLSLLGDSNDVRLSGKYQQERLDFNLNLNRLNLRTMEPFASAFMSQTSGFLVGNMKIGGLVSEPVFEGNFGFKQAGFKLKAINSKFFLEDEWFVLDQQGIHFHNFKLLDAQRQPLSLKGSLLRAKAEKLRFNLDVKTTNFTVLNTTAKDNPAYFGKIRLNSDIKIRGDQNLPIVTANTELLDGSHFTFVVLEGDLNTGRGEDIVVFEDSASLAAGSQKDTLQITSDFQGIDLSANISVNNKSEFKVIVDPESGDNLVVSGDANLSFAIDQSGKISLYGLYTLSKGQYQASFQKVLKREFDMKPGSTISWNGDPTDGQINLTAIYKTQAPSTDLLVAELQGMSEGERLAFRRPLNFHVNLNVEGALLKPNLSFSLDMPQVDQVALNGMPYNRVNIINTDPNELNKQVFSLLVLNKFMPSGTSSGSSPGAGAAVSTVARNSVNQMLTDQLNALSGKYVKGAELNFNLQTTDEFSEAGVESNTSLQVGLKKELFNSRMSVQIGSSIDLSGGNPNGTQTTGQSLAGDVLVEYKITQDGRYKLKAFRENQFEGVIDGIMQRTGMGVSFTRNYNHFSELLKSLGRLRDEDETPKQNE
jgi:hypothetical protein